MTPEETAELIRISSIFGNWSIHLRQRAQQARDIGYGIDDSYSQRLADELQGAVDSIDELIRPLPDAP